MTILQVGLQQSARILLVMVSYESIMVRILRRLSPSRIETITIVMVSILDGDKCRCLGGWFPNTRGWGWLTAPARGRFPNCHQRRDSL